MKPEKITFDTLAKKLDSMHDELKRFISTIENISIRGTKIIKQQKHSICVCDTDFDADFAHLTGKIKKFAVGFRNFWLDASNLRRKLKEKEIVEDNPMILKTFVTLAREINLTIEELESIFGYMRKNIKSSNLHFDWWALEVAVADIMRLSGKILFVSREISRLAEN